MALWQEEESAAIRDYRRAIERLTQNLGVPALASAGKDYTEKDCLNAMERVDAPPYPRRFERLSSIYLSTGMGVRTTMNYAVPTDRPVQIIADACELAIKPDPVFTWGSW